MQLSDFMAASPRGTPTLVARAVGMAPSFLSQVMAGYRAAPPDRCPAIERATAGRVTVEDLRPDVAWVRVPDPDWPHQAGRPCIDVAAPAAADAVVPVRAPGTAVVQFCLCAAALDPVEPEKLLEPCPWTGPGECPHAATCERRRDERRRQAEQMEAVNGLEALVERRQGERREAA